MNDAYFDNKNPDEVDIIQNRICYFGKELKIDAPRIIVFAEPIDYDKLRIAFKFHEFITGFYMGFTASTTSIRNYKQAPGRGDNRENSIGLWIGNVIYAYGKNYSVSGSQLTIANAQSLIGWMRSPALARTEFEVEFDRLKQEMTLFMNQRKLITIQHTFDDMLPVFGLYTPDNELEILDVLVD